VTKNNGVMSHLGFFGYYNGMCCKRYSTLKVMDIDHYSDRPME